MIYKNPILKAKARLELDFLNNINPKVKNELSLCYEFELNVSNSMPVYRLPISRGLEEKAEEKEVINSFYQEYKPTPFIISENGDGDDLSQSVEKSISTEASKESIYELSNDNPVPIFIEKEKEALNQIFEKMKGSQKKSMYPRIQKKKFGWKVITLNATESISRDAWINKKNQINIDNDFPKKTLVEIMRPYLKLYFLSKYSLIGVKKYKSKLLLRKKLLKLKNHNKSFGKKIIKLSFFLNHDSDLLIAWKSNKYVIQCSDNFSKYFDCGTFLEIHRS
jgi:hypothetical protein